MNIKNRAKVTAEAGKPTIIVERMFDAPRDKVFAAMTQKDKLERWWIGPGLTNRVTQLDVRDGGSWQFVQNDAHGNEYSFHGTFHMVSPELTIQTFEFDGLGERGHVSLQKLELTQEGSQTRLLATSVFLSVEDRDGMVSSGMEEGMQQTYDMLEEICKEI